MITSARLRQQPQLDEREQRDPLLPAIERIVVPLDGSQVAERVLAWAVALGRSLRAEILLVRAYGTGSGFPMGNARWMRSRADARDALTPASRYLGRVTCVRRASAADVGDQAHEQDACGSTPVDTYLVAGATCDEFVDGISRIQSHLIVWGRPRDPAERAYWARGAAQLLYSGHRPVLMVP